MNRARKPAAWPAALGPNTRTARRETIARAWRDLAVAFAAELGPHAERRIAHTDDLCQRLGETWLYPAESGAWITTRQFAALAGRDVRTVRGWYGAYPPAWAAPPPRTATGMVCRDKVMAFLDARDEHHTAQTKAA